MTEKQFYSHSSPEGVIKLIEGDTMPPEPEYGICSEEPRPDCFNNEDCRCGLQWKPYRNALQAAKVSSIPIQDQEKALDIMWRNDPNMHNPISYGDWKHAILKLDTIYGPFSVGYRIEFQCRPYDTQDWQSTNEHYWLTVGSSNPCAEKRKIAILYDDTPEKEESQEALLDELVTDIFEIGKEAILEKFTITRK
jgi:hypothetical protein